MCHLSSRLALRSHEHAYLDWLWLGSLRKKLACGSKKYQTILNQNSIATQTRLLAYTWFSSVWLVLCEWKTIPLVGVGQQLVSTCVYFYPLLVLSWWSRASYYVTLSLLVKTITYWSKLKRRPNPCWTWISLVCILLEQHCTSALGRTLQWW